MLPAVSYQGVKSIAQRVKDVCQGLILTIRDGDGNTHRVKLRMSIGFESSERTNILNLIKASQENLLEL